MKYLSILIFGSAFAWSWSLIYDMPEIGIQTHAGIQSNLAKLIVQAVQNKHASARDITILKIRTEEGPAGEIFASFQYRFVEGEGDGNSITSTTSGVATLVKASDNQEGEDRWSLKKIQMLNDSMSFEDGEVINPNQPEQPPSTQPETPAEGALLAEPAKLPADSAKPTTSPTPSPKPSASPEPPKE